MGLPKSGQSKHSSQITTHPEKHVGEPSLLGLLHKCCYESLKAKEKHTKQKYKVCENKRLMGKHVRKFTNHF